MTTKITTDNIASETLTTILGPKVSSIVYPGDDTAANTAGGDSITLLGSGFNNGASVIVNGTSAGVVTVVSSTQITFTAPAQTAGTYVIYVINSDGGTAISIPGISYSGTPTWSTTAGNIGVGYETGSISTTVTASGDAPITYSVVSGTLPTGSSLNTSSGLISGTASATASSTTYSFTISANDAQNQTTNRAFSITVNPDVVTWSTPTSNETYSVSKDIAIANVAMSATSASGGSITYTADTLPTGVSITGANIAGTPTVAASTSTTLTATSTSTRTATRTINWVVSIANDTFFKNVTLLLNGETTVTPFISDASANSFALTIVGDTKPVLFNPYQEGYYSNYFDGTGDYLTTPASSILDVGNTSWTIECWVYMNNTTGTQMIVGYNNTSSSDFWDLTVVSGVPTFKRRIVSSEVVVSGGTVSANIFTHVAVVRNGTAVTIYLNGSSVATNASVSMPTSMSDQILGIGANRYGNGYEYYFNGFISNLRIVKGTAVYTTTFTPSTTPLTAIANTSLLTCQSNRFIDNSTNAFTITKNGDTTVSSAIPFTANSSYSTYGSVYFDGTGDYLTVPDNSTWAFSGDFTIESWIYPTTLAAETAIFTVWYGGSVSLTAINFNVQSTGRLRGEFTVGSSAITTTTGTTTSVTINQWNHVAVSRSGTTIRLFVNGVQDSTTGTLSGTINNLTDQPVIGAINSGGAYLSRMNGYISDVRVITGTAVYTANFTPPTTPLTAITNTSLLTLQYNGGATNQAIIDNSNFNNIITRNGNTSQGTFSPYSVSGWSNYFDTSGTQYISLPTATATAFGGFNSNYTTIEFWAFQTTSSTGATNEVIGTWASVAANGRFYVEIGNGASSTGATSKVFFTWTTSTGAVDSITTTAVVSVNQWVHIAIVVDATPVAGSHTVNIYVNGTGQSFTGRNFSSQTTTYDRLRIAGNSSSYFNGYLSNLRVVRGTSNIVGYSGASITVPANPFVPSIGTVLLTCQSNKFIDNSPINSTLTLSSNPSVQALDPFGSIPEAVPISYSNYFDGTGDYLTTPSSANFTFSADFTIDCWIYVPSISRTIQRIFSSNAGPSGACYFSVGNDIGTGAGAGKLCANGHLVSPYTAGFITASTAIPINTWIHAALVRSGSTITIYQDGVSVASATDSATWDFNNSAGVRISGAIWAGSSEDFGGYISNVRVVKGTAVYTTTFTPSTTPLTAIANTSLLTCQSTTMIDNSTNAFTITAVGNTVPRIFNPFGYTAQSATSYTPSTHGGSAYFDGTTDYLTTPASATYLMTGQDFTVECWAYPTSIPAQVGLVGINNTASSGNANFGIYLETNRNITFWVAGNTTTYSSSNTPITISAWNHIAFVRSGSTNTVYVNGVSVLTNAATPTWSGTPVITVGRLFGDNVGVTFYGYMSDVRVTKRAVYPSNFIPPTQTLTNYSTTNPASLLLNFNNGGIIDYHSSNVLETVGNAQLSTAVKKYNVASIYFDGTGDYLTIPSNQLMNFGTGDFTVEAWVYPNSLSTDWFIASASGSGGFFFGFASTTTIGFGWGRVGTAWDYRVAGNATVSTWQHVAITRSGTSMRLFVNGTQSGTTQTLATAYDMSTTSTTVGSQGANYYLNGYIDDLRITKGYARYTANFTAPTSALITK